jgi:hypothetical protein
MNYLYNAAAAAAPAAALQDFSRAGAGDPSLPAAAQLAAITRLLAALAACTGASSSSSSSSSSGHTGLQPQQTAALKVGPVSNVPMQSLVHSLLNASAQTTKFSSNAVA